jgi:hypothetical protein
MTDVPPPPRRRRRLRWILAVLAVVFVLCCGGTAAGGYAYYHRTGAAAGAAQASTEAFLTSLERDDTAAAYVLLCADVRSRLSGDAFAGYVHQQPRLQAHRIVDRSVAVVDGVDTALVTADLVDAGPAPRGRHTFRLVKDGGAWRVCGDPY